MIGPNSISQLHHVLVHLTSCMQDSCARIKLDSPSHFVLMYGFRSLGLDVLLTEDIRSLLKARCAFMLYLHYVLVHLTSCMQDYCARVKLASPSHFVLMYGFRPLGLDVLLTEDIRPLLKARCAFEQHTPRPLIAFTTLTHKLTHR